MKSSVIIGFFGLLALPGFAQSGEFKTYEGLIYPEVTVNKLKKIVDSLNLKFKVCENRSYHSKLQGKAHYLSLEKTKIREAVADMEKGISYLEFIRKYPQSEVDTSLLVVKSTFRDYDNKKVIEFSSPSLNSHTGHRIRFDKHLNKYQGPVLRKWVYNYEPATRYSAESVDAFYFTDELRSIALPEQYSKLVQYSDCMIDTTAVIFKGEETGLYDGGEENKQIGEFIEYTYRLYREQPKYDESESYLDKLRQWDSLRFVAIDKIAGSDAKFHRLLQAAVEEALASGRSDDQFEKFVERYYSKETALELKRGRKVVGRCSMDDSPREHAVEIARLSAEAIKWEIFLRAHLDVMNDRFDRITDGSYAWAGRKTYIRELEVLDINVHDLLLGITLRINDPAENHYFGSIQRLGRALAETESPELIEKRMLAMIADNNLDDYNRVVVFFLLDNYVYNLDEGGVKKAAIGKLKIAVASLPAYLGKKISIDEP